MMIDDDEPVDPIVDPFGNIDNDPLRHYKTNGYHEESSSSDEDLSLASYKIPASLTIIPSSSAGGLKVHKIPAYSHSLTITRVDSKTNNYHSSYSYRNDYSSPSNDSSMLPSKKGRKKGGKNKFKKGIPIELWNKYKENGYELSNTMINILKENFIQTELSKHLNSSTGDGDFKKTKRKYKKRDKHEKDPLNGISVSKKTVPSVPDLSFSLVVEVDPSEYFPDEPMPKDKVFRKKKKGTEDRTFECEICKKGFKCSKGVVTHKSVKHGIEDLSGYYPCEICEEIFALKRDLTCHYTSHQNNIGRYPCPANDCESTKSDISGLVKHKKKVHPYLGTLGRTWFHTWGDCS